MEPALRENPDATPALQWLGPAYVRAGRVQDAITALEPETKRASPRPSVLSALAIAYVAAGREGDARALLRTVEARASREFFARTWLARAYAALGDNPRALTWLERAYEERDGWVTFANVDPMMDPLRDEPRFKAIVVRMGLSPR
jgi:Flp pilus assembly protein TadD